MSLHTASLNLFVDGIDIEDYWLLNGANDGTFIDDTGDKFLSVSEWLWFSITGVVDNGNKVLATYLVPIIRKFFIRKFFGLLDPDP